ncbi:hypothetical protein JVU11DRAFT_10651 [Chiua virens]|nr:hypothetical protein JVU11DRAFT_10651 [Chiua virens]
MAIQEPFRRSLGSAVQWYAILQVEVDQRIEATLQICCDHVRIVKTQPFSTTPTLTPCTPIQYLPSVMPHHSSSTTPVHNTPTPTSTSNIPASSKQSLTPGSCALILVQ